MRGLVSGIWWAVWTVGTVAGLYVALTSSTFGTWATVGAMGAVLGAWGHGVFERWAPTGPTEPTLVVTAGRVSVGVASAVAWLGIGVASGRLSVVYALICVVGVALSTSVTGPSVRRRWPRPTPPGPPVDEDQDALRLVVRAWSDDQLRWAWRISQHRTTDPDPRRRIESVAQREVLLDEIERRDPAAFASWLTNDAAAGADPGLTPRRRPDGEVS